MSNKDNVIILKDSRPAGYDVALAKHLGSVPAAALFHQLQFWSNRGSRADGWFWKSGTELVDETGVSRRTIDRAIKKLVEAGMIEVRLMRANGAPTRHFKLLKRLDIGIFPITPKVHNPITPKVHNGLRQTVQSNRPLQQTITQTNRTSTKSSLKNTKDLTPEQRAKNRQRLDDLRRQFGMGNQ